MGGTLIFYDGKIMDQTNWTFQSEIILFHIIVAFCPQWWLNSHSAFDLNSRFKTDKLCMIFSNTCTSNSLVSTRNCLSLEAELLFTSPGELLAALDEELELDELTDTLAILSTDSCKTRKKKVLSCDVEFVLDTLR